MASSPRGWRFSDGPPWDRLRFPCSRHRSAGGRPFCAVIGAPLVLAGLHSPPFTPQRARSPLRLRSPPFGPGPSFALALARGRSFLCLRSRRFGQRCVPCAIGRGCIAGSTVPRYLSFSTCWAVARPNSTQRPRWRRSWSFASPFEFAHLFDPSERSSSSSPWCRGESDALEEMKKRITSRASS